jgi:phage-related baseplate assembly protein
MQLFWGLVTSLMNLPIRNFTDIVRDMSAGVTASAGRLIDISIGSVLRAIIEANAAVVLWIQWLVLLTLQTTRAATSSGSDLDSWMADFSLSRLPAASASGTATFSRFSGGATIFVATRTVIKTQDGSVSFAVTADPSNPAWQPILNAYCLAPGVMSLDLPITALISGQSGNVLASTVTVLASPVSGIDTINNAAPTSGGEDPESDPALRTRFANFFAARSRATLDAVGYAISLVGSDLGYVILENADATGNHRLGNMLIVVDDGTGSLTNTLLNSLALSIESVRPLGTTFSIQPPQIMPVLVVLSAQLPTTLSATVTQNLLRTAIETYIINVPIGGTLSLTRISQLAYQTEPRIINIANVTFNGRAIDLIAPPTTSFMPQTVSFI